MACVLAETAADFIRLLAIGYDEICWPNVLVQPPNSLPDEPFVRPNLEFQKWVTQDLGLSIPERGSEIVLNISEYGDEDSEDVFCRWLNEIRHR